MMCRRKKNRLVVCVANNGHEVALERRKVYEVVADCASGKHGLLLVVDESGEDYLYPENFFLPIGLPKPVEKALMAVS
jgi:hypothetical protein